MADETVTITGAVVDDDGGLWVNLSHDDWRYVGQPTDDVEDYYRFIDVDAEHGPTRPLHLVAADPAPGEPSLAEVNRRIDACFDSDHQRFLARQFAGWAWIAGREAAPARDAVLELAIALVRKWEEGRGDGDDIFVQLVAAVGRLAETGPQPVHSATDSAERAKPAPQVCKARYERPGGEQRGDRIVRCHLPAGHPGEHEEADTEVTWTESAPQDTPDAYAQNIAALIAHGLNPAGGLTAADKAAFLAANQELNGPSGLSAEQEIRARALAAAVDWLDVDNAADEQPGSQATLEWLLGTADLIAEYIRAGHLPADTDPPCCIRCGHACAHTPPHALVDSSDGTVCADAQSCAARRKADGCPDCGRAPGTNANNGCEACAEHEEES